MVACETTNTVIRDFCPIVEAAGQGEALRPSRNDTQETQEYMVKIYRAWKSNCDGETLTARGRVHEQTGMFGRGIHQAF